jgi:hypothetical protein
MRHYSSLCLTLILIFLACNNPSTSSPTVSNPEGSTPQVTHPDSDYLTFGKIFKVEPPAQFSFNNPHQVAQHAFFRCSQGQAKELVAEMGHVEKDVDLGKAFLTFLDVFCPDLERFRNQDVYLKFHGYFINKPTTVWYYYLVDAKGRHIEHDSWISLHRSRATGQCALTGIFLFEPKEGTPLMPKNLITSTDQIK